MFDLLPPELVDWILELSVPPASTQDDAKPREKTLRACSSVSQAVGERAQALLWRDVVFRLPDQPARLLKVIREGNVGHLRRAIRSVRWLNKKAPRYDRIEEVVQLSVGLQELELVFSSIPVAFEQFGAKTIASLTTLSLWNIGLLPIPAAFCPFPHLTTLEFEGVYIPPPTLNQLLTPAILPSLQALFFGQFDQDGPSVFPELSPAFVAQLEDFQLTFSPHMTPPFPRAILDSPTPVALFVEVNDLEALDAHVAAYPDSVLPSHLVIDSFYAPRGTSFPASLLCLVNILLAARPPIQSIHFPTSLLLNAGIRADLDAVLAYCEEGSVEVVWRHEEQAFSVGLSSYFRNYARRLKPA